MPQSARCVWTVNELKTFARYGTIPYHTILPYTWKKKTYARIESDLGKHCEHHNITSAHREHCLAYTHHHSPVHNIHRLLVDIVPSDWKRFNVPVAVYSVRLPFRLFVQFTAQPEQITKNCNFSLSRIAIAIARGCFEHSFFNKISEKEYTFKQNQCFLPLYGVYSITLYKLLFSQKKNK